MYNKYALELIQYQNEDSFATDLTRTIDSIFKQIDDKTYKTNKKLVEESGYVRKIESLIKDRFNMTILIDPIMSETHVAAIIPFFQDNLLDMTKLSNYNYKMDEVKNVSGFSNHYNKIFKDKVEYLQKMHNKKSSIDFKNARVTGYLANMKHYIAFNFFLLKSIDITSEEMTAIFLHEIGHGFTGLEFHHKLESTNVVMMDIMKQINNNNNEKAVYIFKHNFKGEEFDKLTLNNNKDIYDFYGKVAMGYVKEIKSQLANHKYNETSFENLADSFATRFNMGIHLATCLNKIQTLTGATNNFNSVPVRVVMAILLLTSPLFMLGCGPAGIYMFVLSSLFIYGSLALVLAIGPHVHMTYDEPLERLNRIKNSIVNNLKNTNLPVDLTKNLIGQIDAIESITKNLYNATFIVGDVAKFISGTMRNDNYYIELQKNIENNLNNLLFVSSQRVRVS